MLLLAIRHKAFVHLSDKEGKKFPSYQKLSVKSDIPGWRIPHSQLGKRLDPLILSLVSATFSFLYTRKMFKILLEILF